MEPYRLNTPDTSAITIELMGHELQFCQDPNSRHLGTTVWDASMVFAKFLERNCRRGRFSQSKLKGKRAIELGSGCGVAGFAIALLGCNVVLTDQKEVLPLLTRNIERNVSRIMQLYPNSDSFGSIQVKELDWGNEDHIKAVDPTFDYIIGTDVVYSEHLLEPLRQTIFALSGPKTTVLLGYEIRSTMVHEQMFQMWKENFEVKIVPKSKMDAKYQHPSIQLFIMGLRPCRASSSIEQDDQVGSRDNKHEEDDNGCCPSSTSVDNLLDQGPDLVKGDSMLPTRLEDKKLSDWEARRYGSMAARLLCDVKIT